MLRLDKVPRSAMLMIFAALSLCLVGFASPAGAQGRGGGHGGGWGNGSGHYRGRGPGGGPGGPGWYGRPPASHYRVVVRGAPYWFWGGRYYRPWRGAYWPVFPPLGLTIGVLPVGFRVVVFGGVNYYTYGGVYYRPAPGGYVVVSPPVTVASPNVVSAPNGVVAPAQGATGVATVTSQALNVRSGPGLAYPVLQVVNLGVDLAIQGRSGSWIYVRTPDGATGWVSQEFTTQSAVGASG